MSKFFVSIFLVHLSLAFSRAEVPEIQLLLDNGDRITGKLISEDELEIRLEVGYLGEVAIPRERITQLSDVEPLLADARDPATGARTEQALSAVGPAKADVSGEEKDSVSETPTDTATVAMNDRPTVEKSGVAGGNSVDAKKKRKGVLARIASAEQNWNPMPQWKKNMQFGYNATTGRKELSTLNYRLDMSRKVERNRFNFNADYAYGEANGSTNLDQYSADFRWRKDISPGAFYETQSIYSVDQIKSIDSNIEQKFGLGTRFLDSEAATFSAGSGATGRWRELAQQGKESDSLVSVFQDWDYRFTEKVRLKQDFKFAMPLDDNDEYQVDFAASIRSDVTDSINLSVRYQFGFDKSLPSDRREDRRIISALGYSF